MDSFGDKVAFVLAKTLICTLGPFAAIYVRPAKPPANSGSS